MGRFPKVVASSVVRSTHRGESHGGVYVIDLNSGTWEQAIDWNRMDISWEGRGDERGLRGIAFYDDKVYLAASNEVLVYDKDFNRLASFGNQYLKECHEICIGGTSLYLSSTKFDSILEFDLVSEQFVQGYCFRPFDALGDVFQNDPVSRSLIKKRTVPQEQPKGITVGRLYHGIRYRMRRVGGLLNGETGTAPKQVVEVKEPTLTLQLFDPNSETGPLLADTLHINNVQCDDERLYFSGTGVGALYCLEGGEIGTYASIPHGTHNVRPHLDGVLMQETASDRITYRSKEGELVEAFDVVRYDEDALLMSDLPKDFCRQAFGRGLAVSDDGLIVAGSSPATVSVFELGNPEPLASVNVTMDVRNAIHGLEIWPY
jgi:hypothetical protein